MLALLVEPFARLWQMLKAHDSPHQLAGGFAIGAVIGLVPKDNLIAVALCVLLCSIKVNKSAGALGALLFVWFGAAVDPLADAVGLRILEIDALQSAYAAIYEMPLGPWIGFHNTAVVGAFVLGVYFSVPIFWLSYLACERIKRQLDQQARRRQADQLVAHMKLGAPWEAAA